MSETLSWTSEQKKAIRFMAEYIQRMVALGFKETKTPCQAKALMTNIYQVTAEVLATSFQRGKVPVCEKGCFWCCYLRVKITPPEGMVIADFLEDHLKSEALSRIRVRLAKTAKITQGMNANQRLGAKILCPLLTDGVCTVYPVRPLACRVYHSLRQVDCQLLVANVGGEVDVRSDVSGLSIGIMTGLATGLQMEGFSDINIELISGLHTLLNSPRSDLGGR